MTADTVGGVWTYALELAAALQPHGVEIALATMGTRLSPGQRAELACCGNVTLFESAYDLEWMNDPWEDVDRAGEWLLEIAARFRPDLVHLNGYSHAALDWNVPVVVVAHSCVLSWWRAVLGEEAPSSYDEYARRVAAGLRAATAVIAPTAAMLSSLREEYGADLDGHVIPNAIRHDLFAPAPKRPVIFAAGRIWDEAKNLRMLDRIAPRLRWPIEVAGEVVHPNGHVVEIDNLHSLGRLTRGRLAARLASAAIYASPARYEPFGLSPLEAGLCGAALVLGDIPSLREIWQDAALFVSPDDEEGTVQTLSGLIANTVRREELGLRARHRALEFRPDKMAAAYREVYAGCLSNVEAEVTG